MKGKELQIAFKIMIQHKCSNSFDYCVSVMIKAFYVAKVGLAFVA